MCLCWGESDRGSEGAGRGRGEELERERGGGRVPKDPWYGGGREREDGEED